jgi:hypothetical protein
MSGAYVPQIFRIQSGTLLSNSSIGVTSVEFVYRTEKSHVLIDLPYPDCWEPLMENEMRESVNRRDAIGVGALQ